MSRGDKGSYTAKHKRKAEHIEERYMKSGVSKPDAKESARATVNMDDGDGEKSGSGGGSRTTRATSKHGGHASAAKRKHQT